MAGCFSSFQIRELHFWEGSERFTQKKGRSNVTHRKERPGSGWRRTADRRGVSEGRGYPRRSVGAVGAQLRSPGRPAGGAIAPPAARGSAGAAPAGSERSVPLRPRGDLGKEIAKKNVFISKQSAKYRVWVYLFIYLFIYLFPKEKMTSVTAHLKFSTFLTGPTASPSSLRQFCFQTIDLPCPQTRTSPAESR